MNICISGLNYHNTALTTTQNRGGSFYKKVCEAILSSIFLNKMDFSSINLFSYIDIFQTKNIL